MKQIKRLFTALFLLLSSAVALASGVDINTADAATLAASIDGVGEKRAMAIIEYRQANGPFQNVDELTKVKGIGAKLLEQNRDNLVAGQVTE